MIKLYFASNGPCIIYLFLFFTGKTIIQMIEMGTSARCLWDPVLGRPGE